MNPFESHYTSLTEQGQIVGEVYLAKDEIILILNNIRCFTFLADNAFQFLNYKQHI